MSSEQRRLLNRLFEDETNKIGIWRILILKKG